jgi:hypothetical protein
MFAACSALDCAGSSSTADVDAGGGTGGGGALGGAGGSDSVYDAGPPCAERTEANCDPAQDCGCGAGLRCAQVYESLDPWTVHTACVAVGTHPIGAGCAVDATTRIDDCVGGAVCLSNGCQALCHVAADAECASNEACMAVAGYFADRPGIGACHRICDPLAQNCSAGEGCFYDTRRRIGVCATIQNDPSTGTIGGQGDPCQAANSCERGTACLFLDPQSPTGNRCATYCDPSSTNPCAPLGGSLTCKSLDALYPNAGLPVTLGLCVP